MSVFFELWRQEESITALLKSTQLEKLDLFDCQQLSCSDGTLAALEGQQLQSLKLLDLDIPRVVVNFCVVRWALGCAYTDNLRSMSS